jgi:hypothetical protein
MNVEMVSMEEMILQDIKNKASKRDSVALRYSFCISSDEVIDYEKINKAIVARWNRGALTYIKNKAWKRVEESGYTGPIHESMYGGTPVFSLFKTTKEAEESEGQEEDNLGKVNLWLTGNAMNYLSAIVRLLPEAFITRDASFAVAIEKIASCDKEGAIQRK